MPNLLRRVLGVLWELLRALWRKQVQPPLLHAHRTIECFLKGLFLKATCVSVAKLCWSEICKCFATCLSPWLKRQWQKFGLHGLEEPLKVLVLWDFEKGCCKHLGATATGRSCSATSGTLLWTFFFSFCCVMAPVQGEKVSYPCLERSKNKQLYSFDLLSYI